VTREGELWTWGWGRHGRLGHPPDINMKGAVGAWPSCDLRDLYEKAAAIGTWNDWELPVMCDGCRRCGARREQVRVTHNGDGPSGRCRGPRAGGELRAGTHRRVSRAFPSCTRSILTEICRCHACSCQAIEDDNARPGSWWAAGWSPSAATSTVSWASGPRGARRWRAPRPWCPARATEIDGWSQPWIYRWSLTVHAEKRR
jgi:hypothetical protein